MHVHKKHIHINQSYIHPNKSYKPEWFARHEVITIAFDKSAWIPCLHDHDLSWIVHHLQHKLNNLAINVTLQQLRIQSSRIQNILEYLLCFSVLLKLLVNRWSRLRDLDLMCICPVCLLQSDRSLPTMHMLNTMHIMDRFSLELSSKQWMFTTCGASLQEDIRWSWAKEWGQPPSSVPFWFGYKLGNELGGSCTLLIPATLCVSSVLETLQLWVSSPITRTLHMVLSCGAPEGDSVTHSARVRPTWIIRNAFTFCAVLDTTPIRVWLQTFSWRSLLCLD